MKYKLLVLDVDGTLLNDEREISKRTLAALLKVQQMGVRIVLASGRPTYGLMPLAKTLELGNYGGFVLSYNGCQIIKARTEKYCLNDASIRKCCLIWKRKPARTALPSSPTTMIPSLRIVRTMNI